MVKNKTLLTTQIIVEPDDTSFWSKMKDIVGFTFTATSPSRKATVVESSESGLRNDILEGNRVYYCPMYAKHFKQNGKVYAIVSVFSTGFRKVDE